MVYDVAKALESSWTIVGMTSEGCFFRDVGALLSRNVAPLMVHDEAQTLESNLVELSSEFQRRRDVSAMVLLKLIFYNFYKYIYIYINVICMSCNLVYSKVGATSVQQCS